MDKHKLKNFSIQDCVRDNRSIYLLSMLQEPNWAKKCQRSVTVDIKHMQMC